MPDTSTATICFEEGIIGVPRAKRFEILAADDSPIRVLRCLDIDGFALPVVDPALADPAYRPSIPKRLAESIGLDPDSPAVVLAVTVRDKTGSHCNLRAPIVLNPERRLALQIILDDRSLPLRAPLRLEAR
jgi:flagellar assembly factor FliW